MDADGDGSLERDEVKHALTENEFICACLRRSGHLSFLLNMNSWSAVLDGMQTVAAREVKAKSRTYVEPKDAEFGLAFDDFFAFAFSAVKLREEEAEVDGYEEMIRTKHRRAAREVMGRRNVQSQMQRAFMLIVRNAGEHAHDEEQGREREQEQGRDTGINARPSTTETTETAETTESRRGHLDATISTGIFLNLGTSTRFTVVRKQIAAVCPLLAPLLGESHTHEQGQSQGSPRSMDSNTWHWFDEIFAHLATAKKELADSAADEAAKEATKEAAAQGNVMFTSSSRPASSSSSSSSLSSSPQRWEAAATRPWSREAGGELTSWRGWQQGEDDPRLLSASSRGWQGQQTQGLIPGRAKGQGEGEHSGARGATRTRTSRGGEGKTREQRVDRSSSTPKKKVVHVVPHDTLNNGVCSVTVPRDTATPLMTARRVERAEARALRENSGPLAGDVDFVLFRAALTLWLERFVSRAAAGEEEREREERERRLYELRENADQRAQREATRKRRFQLERLREVFDVIDTDGSNTLDQREFLDAVHSPAVCEAIVTAIPALEGVRQSINGVLHLSGWGCCVSYHASTSALTLVSRRSPSFPLVPPRSPSFSRRFPSFLRLSRWLQYRRTGSRRL